jgi:transposase-like protein
MWLHEATVRNVSRAIREVQGIDVEGDYRPAARAALKAVLEASVEDELRFYTGRERYERGAPGGDALYRNGTVARTIYSELGPVVLRLGRLRKAFESRVISRYSRRPAQVDRLILACFLLGMSTRKAARTLCGTLGISVSHTTVSNVCAALDREVARYHGRRLEGNYRFLYFDAVHLWKKGAAGRVKKTVLTVTGVTREWRHERIDFLVSCGESEASWEGFINELHGRGLTGEGVELIVIDGNRALANALERVYPRIPRQLCWAHKMRNVSNQLSKSGWTKVKPYVQAISHAPSRKEAIEAFWAFSKAFKDKHPKAVKTVADNLEHLLEFYRIQPSKETVSGRPVEERSRLQTELWKKVRTTNLIERSFKEVRRRTRPMGIFENTASMERIIFSVFYYLDRNSGDNDLFLFTQKT